jgi:hypothetical protein
MNQQRITHDDDGGNIYHRLSIMLRALNELSSLIIKSHELNVITSREDILA